VLATRRDFSFMGGFLFAGMVIALLAGLAAMFLQMPALGLAVSAMVALLSAGLILFETSRIVNGGETNYVLATVGLFVSLFNLFTSLLSLFGFAGNNDEATRAREQEKYRGDLAGPQCVDRVRDAYRPGNRSGYRQHHLYLDPRGAPAAARAQQGASARAGVCDGFAAVASARAQLGDGLDRGTVRGVGQGLQRA